MAILRPIVQNQCLARFGVDPYRAGIADVAQIVTRRKLRRPFDPDTVPASVDLAERQRNVKVTPTSKEFEEIMLDPFVGLHKPDKAGPPD